MEKKISDGHKVSWKFELGRGRRKKTVLELKEMDFKQGVYLALILEWGWVGRWREILLPFISFPLITQKR